MKLKQRFQPFLQAIPQLLLFQFVSTVILSLVTLGISVLGSLLLGLSGKAAVTSGDLSFLFTRWQGYVVILLLLAMVTIYVAVELNALIIFCNKILSGEKPNVWLCIKEGFVGLKKFLSLRGVVIILYAVVLAPIFGLGFSISLTQNFYIPKFPCFHNVTSFEKALDTAKHKPVCDTDDLLHRLLFAFFYPLPVNAEDRVIDEVHQHGLLIFWKRAVFL